MREEDDPWAWTKTNKQAAPLAASIQPSTEQAPPPSVAPDPLGQQLTTMGITKGVDALGTGMQTAYKAYGAPLAAPTTSTASQALLGAPAPAMSLAPAVTPAATTALTEAGITGLTAPLASTAGNAALLGTEAATTGALTSAIPGALTATAVPGALASTAAAGTAAAAAPVATAGLGAAAAAGGEAALLGMGPVGWAIAAGLLAKKLKLF